VTPRRLPRVVYRDRPRRGCGWSVIAAFACGLLAIFAAFANSIGGVILFLGLAVLCMLSAILQKIK
jgi:hypothetical protein